MSQTDKGQLPPVGHYAYLMYTTPQSLTILYIRKPLGIDRGYTNYF
jgi:hypothetical protein